MSSGQAHAGCRALNAPGFSSLELVAELQQLAPFLFAASQLHMRGPGHAPSPAVSPEFSPEHGDGAWFGAQESASDVGVFCDGTFHSSFRLLR